MLLRTFLRLVDRGCDALTLMALPALLLLWLSGLADALRESWAGPEGGLGTPWRHAAALWMAAIARSFTRDRAPLHARTLFDDWPAAGQERMRRFVSALCVWPWCAYVLWAGASSLQPAAAWDLAGRELALLQAALWCAALVLALHALLDIFAPRRPLQARADTAVR